MKKLLEKLLKTLQRGGLAFSNYPASMGLASALAIFSIWLIHSEPDSEKLFISIIFSLAMSAMIAMVSPVIFLKIKDNKIARLVANITPIGIFIVASLILYFPKDNALSENEMLRVFAIMIVSLLTFLFVPTINGKILDFNKMVFMTIKSFFMSVVYGLVLMLGSFFVAFAVKALLYEDLNSKIFAYIAIISGLVSYAFYLGYFPNFKKNEQQDDPVILSATKQPKFATVLFQNILIPIMGAMTLVLFVWILRILFTGEWPSYNQTIAIFTTYSLVGILLYFLVTSYDNLVVKIYKRVFPIATLLFLAFEAYPIFEQINNYAIEPMDYTVVFVWIFAVVTSILFILLPISKNKVVSYIAILLVILYVLPGVGAIDLSYKSQNNHLKQILIENDMLVNNQVVPNADISYVDKIKITKSFNYLVNNKKSDFPEYLPESEDSFMQFTAIFGFERAYEFDMPDGPSGPVDKEIKYINLNVESNVISLEDYEYFIAFSGGKYSSNSLIQGSSDEYDIEYIETPLNSNYPRIVVSLSDEEKNIELLNESIEELVIELSNKYEDYFSQGVDIILANQNEMSVVFENDKVKVKLLFGSINISNNELAQNYYDLLGIYFKEK